MPFHAWTVLCDRQITDAETNNVSLINIIEQIRITKTEELQNELASDDATAISFRHTLVSLWTRDDINDPESFFAQVCVVGPDGALLGEANQSLDLREKIRVRATIRGESLPLVGEGRYWFVVKQSNTEDGPWTECARIPLDCMIVDPSPQEQE